MAGGTPEGKKNGFFHRLYVGTGAIDVVGHRKGLYVFFSTLVLVSLAFIVFKGFNFGIDFKGGTKIQLESHSQSGQVISTDDVTKAYQDALGSTPEAVQAVGLGDSASIQIRTVALNAAQVDRVKTELTNQFHPKGTISDSAVSGTWGGEVTQQALIALLVFLVLVTIFLALYFERRMAVAALITLFHDVIVTAGVYSVIGLEVTPATAIGLLTILGFSLYDTVVVFDKVKENTRGILGLTRRTYGEAANLAVNQTLMRSINTALIALLPVLGLFIVGALLLGVGTLQDLALIQMTGLIVGVSSSIALATPLLVDLTMRDKRYKQQAKRVESARKARLSRQAASTGTPDEAGEAIGDDEPESFDKRSMDEQARRQRAMAAAGGVPVRNARASDRHRRRTPQGKRQK